MAIKSWIYFCREILEEADNYFRVMAHKNNAYNAPTLKEYKAKVQKLYDARHLMWINTDGNFPIGNKSGFDAIFSKIMQTAIGCNHYFPFIEIQNKFLAESAKYYEEHLMVDYRKSAEDWLNKWVKERAEKVTLPDHMDEDINKFKKYLNSLEIVDQIDVDVYSKIVSPLLAQYVIEEIMFTEKIKPGEFVTVRNYVYEKAVDFLINKLIGKEKDE